MTSTAGCNAWSSAFSRENRNVPAVMPALSARDFQQCASQFSGTASQFEDALAWKQVEHMPDRLSPPPDSQITDAVLAGPVSVGNILAKRYTL